MKSRNNRKNTATPNTDTQPKDRHVLVRRIRNPISSPGGRVIVFVTAIMGLVIGVRILGWKQNAQVKFIETSETDRSKLQQNAEPIQPPSIFSGEAYQTIMRLREAAALGLAVSLTVFAEFAEKRLLDSTEEAVLGSLAQRKLLPPGIEIHNGRIVSQLSRYRLNYEASPLGFEIMSEPAPGVPGPSFLFRFPLPAAKPGTVSYFQSRQSASHQAPNPFSTPDQLVAMGWTIEYWQGDIFPIDESTVKALREQNEWLMSQNR